MKTQALLHRNVLFVGIDAQMGAFICAAIVRVLQESGMFLPGSFGAQLSIIIGFILAAGIGAAFSLLLSYASIKWKADQTITGTALNLIAPAIVLFVANVFFNQNKIQLKIDAASWCIIKMPQGEGFFHDLLAIFFDRTYITTFICVAIFVVLSIILYRTKFGLRLRSCGEHPQAADSVGINVYKMRYIGTTISGALAGIGGYTYALTIDGGSATGAVAGFGFLALAIMIFGNWKPLNIAIVSFVVGWGAGKFLDYSLESLIEKLSIKRRRKEINKQTVIKHKDVIELCTGVPYLSCEHIDVELSENN